MLTEKDIEEIYKELLRETIQISQEQGSEETPLATEWSSSFWDDRLDNISEEEWHETLEIHARKRRETIVKMLGDNYGS